MKLYRFFHQIWVKWGTTILQVGIKYSTRYQISDVISYCALSCDIGKIRLGLYCEYKIAIEAEKYGYQEISHMHHVLIVFQARFVDNLVVVDVLFFLGRPV